jgi:type II restriction enzyme
MELTCDLALAEGYKSPSQRARVLSEAWLEKNGYCLACDADELRKTPANTKATDFICPKCSHGYELKAFKGKRPRVLSDGAFGAMMQKIHGGTAPTLCLMERTEEWVVRGLTAIHSSFVLPDVIVKRRALTASARRRDWVGCNIRLDRIDASADVSVVSAGVVQPVELVRRRFQRYLPLAKKSVEQRGWTLLTLGVVRGLGKREFTLQEMYALEAAFARAYPQNRHVRDKIRQQLQILRDLGVLVFEGSGEYRLLD